MSGIDWGTRHYEGEGGEQKPLPWWVTQAPDGDTAARADLQMCLGCGELLMVAGSGECPSCGEWHVVPDVVREDYGTRARRRCQ